MTDLKQESQGRRSAFIHSLPPILPGTLKGVIPLFYRLGSKA